MNEKHYNYNEWLSAYEEILQQHPNNQQNTRHNNETGKRMKR